MQNLLRRTETLVFLILTLTLGIIGRIFLFPVTSGDQWQFLRPWVEYLAQHGGFAAVGHDLGDYTPLYYYFLALLTYLPVDPIVGIKIISCLGDAVLAFLAMKTAALLTKSELVPVLVFPAVFLLPTVMLNSAAWAQCDVLFTACLIACLYYLLQKRDLPAMVCFGLSFAFKLQAIFLAPLLLVLLLKKAIRPLSLAAIPAVYMLSILPALFAGGDLLRLLTVYFRQPGQYSLLNMSIPNAWSLFVDVNSAPLGRAGVLFAGAVLLIFIYALHILKFRVTPDAVLCLAAIFSMGVPFLLPHMHERYYYLSDIIAVLFAVRFPKRFWMPLVSQFLSVQSISLFLFGREPMDLRILTVLAVVWLIGAGAQLRTEMRKAPQAPLPEAGAQ